MPQLIEHIDAIARQKQRAVLYLEFHPESFEAWQNYDYERDTMRTAVLDWLDEHAVPWQPCGPFADVRMLAPYLGQVYIDIPYDESLSAYCTVRDYLEWPDGSMRQPGVRFYAMPLEYAMRNAAHDAPGYWEQWAGNL